jgi:NAD(P)-dependent dehydrogenase (short-subunit alcohol dehydrogenase family)
MSDRLVGRHAIVTGASRGIGAGIARRLAAEGAKLTIAARTLESHPTLNGSLTETAEACREHGVAVGVVVADMADADSRAAVVPAAVAANGPVDILVNNAAAAIYQSLTDYPLKRRRLMTEINVQAPFDLTQQVLGSMEERGEGWIVNLSSGSKHHPDGPPYDLGGVRGVYGWYGATKAMLDRATTALASEVQSVGIRLNCVEPRAAVMSEGAEAVLGNSLSPEQIESLEAMVESVLFLCDCGPDHTGNLEVSLDLVEREAITVMALDGASPHPNGIRP